MTSSGPKRVTAFKPKRPLELLVELHVIGARERERYVARFEFLQYFFRLSCVDDREAVLKIEAALSILVDVDVDFLADFAHHRELLRLFQQKVAVVVVVCRRRLRLAFLFAQSTVDADGAVDIHANAAAAEETTEGFTLDLEGNVDFDVFIAGTEAGQ